MRRRRITAAQLKDKRNKKIAGALGAVFLVVLVIQIPKLMKQMSPPKATPPSSVAATAPSTAPSTAGVTGSTASSGSTIGSTGGGTLTIAPAPQLDTFAKLPLKDPFRALVGATSGGSGTTATPAAPATKPTSSTPKSGMPSSCSVVLNSQTEAFICARKKQKATKAAASQPAASGTMTFTAKTPPNAAIVKMNGKQQTVFVGDGFPAANPLFKLVALGEKTVRVGVFGGSFTSGGPTIKLAKGKKVTLANKADGSHYVIELVKLTTAVAPVQSSPTSSSSSSSGTSTTPSSSGTSTTPSSSTDTTTTSTSTSP